MIKVAPSILSADFAHLGRDIEAISTADYVHVDVMDGLFVPNISIGIPVVKSIRPTTTLPLDVHLMIDRPIRYAEQFCDAGGDLITCHVEADTEESIHAAIDKIHAKGKKAGVVIKPRTPASAVLPFIDKVEAKDASTVTFKLKHAFGQVGAAHEHRAAHERVGGVRIGDGVEEHDDALRIVAHVAYGAFARHIDDRRHESTVHALFKQEGKTRHATRDEPSLDMLSFREFGYADPSAH